jgi:uncharacterized membrane protein YfcA
MEIIWYLSYPLLGAVVGIMAGLLGIGGGGIMVPVLTSLFLAQGIEADKVVHLALGTSMASIVVTSFASMRAHNRKQAVLWDIVKSMSPGIILGTFGATFIVAMASSIYLAGFFSLFMGYVSLQMFLNKKPKPGRAQVGNGAMFGAGTGIGAISALVSIGGGSLTVPFLVWQNIDMKKAIGTSAAVGLPISIAGTLGYVINGWSVSSTQDYSFGFVYLPAVLLISLCSYLTAPLGAALAHSLPVHALKKVFAVLLLGLSLKMLFSVIQS